MMKPFFAFLALFLCLAALWPVVTVSTAAQPEPYTGEPPVVEDKPAEGSAELTIGEPRGEFKLTAYCPCMKCCGKTDGITSTGTLAAEGRTIAVDPRVIPYGSTVTLYYEDGTVHTYTAEDCGGAIKENRIDVFFSSHDAARAFGVQSAMVYVEEEP